VATETPSDVGIATARHGGWLDEIDFSVVPPGSAVSEISAGTLDVFASGLNFNQLPAIQAAGLKSANTMGTVYSIMYNPAACTDPNTLNPFNDRKIPRGHQPAV